MSYYVHQVPGRLRIKSPSIKGNQKEAVVVEDLLKRMEGIKSSDGQHPDRQRGGEV